MATIAMPRLSDAMEEGTIVRWLVEDGARVARGQEIAEIETDKATVVYEAEVEGTLRIVVAEGDTVPIGETIATVGDGEPVAAADGAPAPQPGRAESEAPPLEAPASALASERRSAPKISPLARRIAREHGVDLQALAGSGPGGRIVKADVLAAVAQKDPDPPPPRAVAGAEADGARPTAADEAPTGAVERVELTRLQAVVARRMVEATSTIPAFTVTADVEMDACRRLRAQLADALAEGPVPSYNDMIVKASALALAAHPRANASYADGAIATHSRVNVGVAVAADGVLVVPTIADADRRPLGEITTESRRLAAAVRDGTVRPPELAGGTFTVSNLGMYGVTSFTAVVNPPQAAILAVGTIAERIVPRDGQAVARHMMSLTLTCDHRVLYGADGAALLATIRELLEQPLRLLL